MGNPPLDSSSIPPTVTLSVTSTPLEREGTNVSNFSFDWKENHSSTKLS